jgi:Flp pilus assembly protein TadG
MVGARQRVVLRLFEDSRGVTAIEYALIAAVIAMAGHCRFPVGWN